ncbi:MAG: phage tail protein [Pseudomonadota bacterium]
MQLAVFAIGIGLQILASYLKPKMKTEPSPEDKITDSAFGSAVEEGWGTRCHTGTLLWRGPRNEEESSVGGKGGGGGASQWTYSQSFLMSFCKTKPDQVVLRIWKNKTKLIYDITGDNTGTVSNIDIIEYPGDEAQTPPPAIEAVEGSGNVPGYRGIFCVMFDNMDTTEDGGRIPDLMAEITNSAGTGDPLYHQVLLADIDASISLLDQLHSDKYNEFLYGRCNLGLAKLDTDTDELVYAGYPYESYHIRDWDVDDAGYLWVLDWETAILGTGGEMRLLRLDPDSMTPQPVLIIGTPFLDLAGNNKQWERICCINGQSAILAVSGVRGLDYPTDTDPYVCLARYNYAWDEENQVHVLSEDWRVYAGNVDLDDLERFAALDTAGVVHAVLNNPGTLVHVESEIATTDDWTGRTTTNIHYVPSNNELAASDDDHTLRFWDLALADWSATEIESVGRHLLTPWLAADKVWYQEDEEAYTYGLNEVDLAARELLVEIVNAGVRMDCYDGSSQSFWSPSTVCVSNCIGKYLLREMGGARVPVAGIVTDLCESVGLTGVDVSTIDDTTLGFKSPGNTAPRQDLEVLAKAFLLELVQDGLTSAIQRRYPTVPKTIVEIPWDDLGAHEAGQEPPSRLIHNIHDELEYPREVIVQSVDQEHAYERGGERAFRAATNSRLIETFDLTQCVLNEAERRSKAGSILPSRWGERHFYSGTTHRKYYDLRPGDVIRVQPPGEDHSILINKVELGAPGLVKFEGHQYVYQLPEPPPGPEPELYVPPVVNGYYVAVSLYGYYPKCEVNWNATKTGFSSWGGQFYQGDDWNPASILLTPTIAERDADHPFIYAWTGAWGTVGRGAGKWYAEVACSGCLNTNMIVVGLCLNNNWHRYVPLGNGTGLWNGEYGYWAYGFNNYTWGHQADPDYPARLLNGNLTAPEQEYGKRFGWTYSVESGYEPAGNVIGISLDASGDPWTLSFSIDGVDQGAAFSVPMFT